MKKHRLPVFVLFLFSYGLPRLCAQNTQIVYLCGQDKDRTVNWEFYVNTVHKNGDWYKIPVPSNCECQGFDIYNYFQDTKKPKEHGRYKYHFKTAPHLNR
jgi:hypothetical protein